MIVRIESRTKGQKQCKETPPYPRKTKLKLNHPMTLSQLPSAVKSHRPQPLRHALFSVIPKSS